MPTDREYFYFGKNLGELIGKFDHKLRNSAINDVGEYDLKKHYMGDRVLEILKNYGWI